MGRHVINLSPINNPTTDGCLASYQHQWVIHVDDYVNVNLLSAILAQIWHFSMSYLVKIMRHISLFVLALFFGSWWQACICFWQWNKFLFLSSQNKEERENRKKYIIILTLFYMCSNEEKPDRNFARSTSQVTFKSYFPFLVHNKQDLLCVFITLVQGLSTLHVKSKPSGHWNVNEGEMFILWPLHDGRHVNP